MARPTREQVLALAPDPSSLKAGQAQASPAKWPGTGTDGAHAWGECKGSGAKPYQVSVDLADLATACSCPSRKFPCKHALGLMLLLADDGVPAGTPADWTVEWRDKRAQRAEKKTAPPTPEDEEARAKAAAKRAASRESKVDDGVAALQQWLEDLVRTGFATLSGQSSATFETTAARMVDAQAKGLADRVRTLGWLARSSDHEPDWSPRMLDAAGSTALLARAWQRRADLDDATRAQVATRVGYPSAEPDQTVRDTWTLLGHELREDDITMQRQWLLGRSTGRVVTLLSFAGPGATLDVGMSDGDTDAELALHPGPLPSRAVVRERQDAIDAGPPDLPPTWTAALAQYRDLLAQDPWSDLTALGCRRAAIVPGEPWLARDDDGRALPLRDDGSDRRWRALAHTGGRPTALAGEWDGRALRVLSVEDSRGRWRVLR